MRLFVAIELSGEMKKELAVISKALRERATGGKFVSPENMHITLHYIGETEETDKIASVLREVSRGRTPFEISLGKYGYFEKTSSGNHRVSLVTVGGDITALDSLRAGLLKALTEAGYPGDGKPFMPHITLGRNVGVDELAAFELEGMRPDKSQTVTGVTLFESTRRDGKLVYIPIHRESFLTARG